MAKLLVVLAAFVAVCAASSLREKRQVLNNRNVNCGGNVGPVEDPNDCSFFFECDANGEATRKACVAGLEFNPQNRQCDYPSNMPNPRCNRISDSSRRNEPCNGIVGVGQVAHQQFCNAYMICGSGFLYDGCLFCAAGQYFDGRSGKCTGTYNVETVQACNGREMVPAVSQEIRRLEGSCWPSDPSRFQVLLDKIRREGGIRQ